MFLTKLIYKIEAIRALDSLSNLLPIFKNHSASCACVGSSTFTSQSKYVHTTSLYCQEKGGDTPKIDSKEKSSINKSTTREPDRWGTEQILGRRIQDMDYPDRKRYRKLYRDPFYRTLGILKDDLVEFFAGHLSLRRHPLLRVKNKEDDSVIGQYFPDEREIFPDYCDVVIVGGGAIGMSIAYHLKETVHEGLRIVIVEKDTGYANSSTVHSVGGIRQQFSLPENIQLSQYGFDFLRKSNQLLAVKNMEPPSIGMDFHGYLTLATEEGMDQLRENYNIQRQNKAFVELLSPAEIKGLYPWIDLTGIAGGVVGTRNEGWFDPWAFLLALGRKVQFLGAELMHAEVVDINTVDTGDILNKTEDIEVLQRVNSVSVRIPDGTTRDINCAMCVFAGGAYNGQLGKLAGIGVKGTQSSLKDPIPIEPRKRYVYCIEAPDGPGINSPLLVDPTGTYFRREGLADLYLCGRSPTPEEEPEDLDRSNVDIKYFEEKIWPVLVERCPGFERLKVKSSWAGYYDYNTFDQNGIIGYHPGFANLIVAGGFSGHGIQMAAGVGRAVKELILSAEYKTIDLENFGFDRFEDNKPLRERLIV